MGSVRSRGAIAAVLSLALSLVAAVVLAFAPLASQTEAVPSSLGGTGVVGRVERVSLLEHEGASVLIPLAVPVAIAALGLAADRSRRPRTLRTVAAGLLVVFVLLGAMSIGLFYLPSAVAMVVAAVQTEQT